MVLPPPDPIAIIIFSTVVLSVTYVILRRPFNQTNESLTDSETVTIPDPDESPESRSNGDRDQRDHGDLNGYRSCRGRRQELQFSKSPQSDQFGGGFNQSQSEQREFGSSFRSTSNSRLDSTSSWALPPDEVEDEEEEHRSHGSNINESGTVDHCSSDPSPYLFSGQDDETEQQSGDKSDRF